MMNTTNFLRSLLIAGVMGFFCSGYVLSGAENIMVDGWSEPHEISHHSQKLGPAPAQTQIVEVGADIRSDRENPWTAKGNVFRVDTDVNLLRQEFYLDFTTTQTLTFYIYESSEEFGSYNRIFQTAKIISGSGPDWYSSGIINIPLKAGHYYLLAFSWDDSIRYFFSINDTVAVSFGAWKHGYAVGFDSLPETVETLEEDWATYHQRLILGDLSKPVVIFSPNGGEEIVAGSDQTIQWYQDDNIAEILVEYSSDDGQNWNTITKVSDNNSLTWTTPIKTSDHCLIRISDASNPDVFDISDAAFTIYKCLLRSDLNKDCRVDLADLIVLSALWLADLDEGNCPAANLTGTRCKINLDDYAVLVNEWLKCGNPFDPGCP